MPRWLLLDVDGGVVTGRPSDGQPWKTSLQPDLGIDPDWLRRQFFAPHWAQIIRGQCDMMPVLAQVLDGTGVSAEALRAYWFAQDSRVDDRVRSDVARLRAAGWQVRLATNQEPHRMEALAALLPELAEGAFCSGWIGAPKPEPAFYQTIETTLGAAPADLVLVDDGPANVEAARARGWHGVLWPQPSLWDALAQL